MAVRESTDILCFRVMRLNRPVFSKQQCDPAELCIDEIAGCLTVSDAAVRADLDGVPISRLSMSDSLLQSPDDDVFNASNGSHESVRVKVGGPGELLNFTPFFGSAYLGEMFSAHVNLYNQSNETCHNVELKVALHNRIEWLTLFTSGSLTGASIPALSSEGGQRTSGVDLLPGQSLSAVIYHELKELGVHTLRCTATYSLSPTSTTSVHLPSRPGSFDVQPPSGFTFERLYKFQSNKPLDVKKKFSAVEPDGSVFMEAQVQNLTSSPIFLERVIFEPTANMTATDLSCLDNSLSTYSTLKLLRPENVQHFLYRLVPHANPQSTQPSSLKSTSVTAARPLAVTTAGRNLQQSSITAGRLDITWRSTMGERGRLQTSSLKYEVPISGDIQMKTVELPATVKIEQPFHVKVEVTNRCTNQLDLTLDLRSVNQEESTGVPLPSLGSNATPLNLSSSLATKRYSPMLSPLVWMGLTTRKLGGLSPGCSISLTLDIMATIPGLQVVSGVLIRESTSGRQYEFNNLGQVLVCLP